MANRKTKDLVGMRFSRLVVVGGRTQDAKGNASWDCKCDCGGTIKVRMSSLQNGITKSCGCLASEHATRNGHKSKTHGLSQIPEYKVWSSMVDRCADPEHKAYNDYGGRGITVCQEWLELENFIRDMGSRPSDGHQLDRIDNSQGYSPSNCRWATRKENQRNKRDNVIVMLDGRAMTIAEASELTSINYTTIHYRYNKGRTQDTGLFAPVKAKPE